MQAHETSDAAKLLAPALPHREIAQVNGNRSLAIACSTCVRPTTPSTCTLAQHLTLSSFDSSPKTSQKSTVLYLREARSYFLLKACT